MTTPLADLRSEYAFHAGRSIALPLAGALVWTLIGLAALFLPARTATMALIFGTGAIFPIALALARPLRERLIDNPSPLAALMGRSVLMVNLLWAVHLTVYTKVPEMLPLTLGIGLGLHWIVFGWVIDHRLGVIHAAVRTVLVATMWWMMPGARISAVAAAVVAAYAYSILALMTRPITERVRQQSVPIPAAPGETVEFKSNNIASADAGSAAPKRR